MSSTPSPSQAAPPPPTSSLHLADEFLARQTPMMRVRAVLYRYPAISPAIVLVISVVIFVRFAIGRAGVIMSLSFARLNLAGFALTVTDVTLRAWRSRSKLDSAWVAVAVILLVPVRIRVVGSYAIAIA